MHAGTGFDVPRRIPLEQTVDEDAREILAAWFQQKVRRERITREGEVTPRLNYLEKILDAVQNGDDVEVHSDDLPHSLQQKTPGWVLLTGHELIRK